MNINYLELSATIISIYTVYLISIPSIKGYYTGMIGQLLWAAFSIQNHHPLLLVQCIILSVINVGGWYNWRRKHIG